MICIWFVILKIFSASLSYNFSTIWFHSLADAVHEADRAAEWQWPWRQNSKAKDDRRGNSGETANDRVCRRSEPEVHEAGEDRTGVSRVSKNAWRRGCRSV